MYTNVNLQRATQLALESFVKKQEDGQANSAPKNRAFKAHNPNFYYETSYIKYYYLYWQYKN